jgi:hypothetical protein
VSIEAEDNLPFPQATRFSPTTAEFPIDKFANELISPLVVILPPTLTPPPVVSVPSTCWEDLQRRSDDNTAVSSTHKLPVSIHIPFMDIPELIELPDTDREPRMDEPLTVSCSNLDV